MRHPTLPARHLAAAATLLLALLPALALAALSPEEQRQTEVRIGALREALKKDPDNPELVAQLARQLSLQGRTAEAARQYARVLAVYPDNADYLLGQGQNFLHSAQPERALAPLRRAQRLAPAYQDVQRALGQALAAAGRKDEARTLYARALQRFNRPVWAQQGLAALDAPPTAAAAAASAAAGMSDLPTASAAPAPQNPPGVTAPQAAAAATQAQAAPAAPAAAPPEPVSAAAPAPDTVLPPPPVARNSVEAGSARESLSNGTPAWRDEYLQFQQQFDGRRGWLGRITSASRFGIADSVLLMSAYTPVAAGTSLSLEASISPTHRVLAQNTFHAQISHSLPAGWGVQAGWKRMKYNTTSIDALDLTIERYFGPFRAAWTLNPSRSSTAGDTFGQRFQFGYFYTDFSAVQVLVAAGREADKPVAANSIVATDVRSTALFGHHAFSPQWGLVYGIGRTQQGTTTRAAANLGLRFRF